MRTEPFESNNWPDNSEAATTRRNFLASLGLVAVMAGCRASASSAMRRKKARLLEEGNDDDPPPEYYEDPIEDPVTEEPLVPDEAASVDQLRKNTIQENLDRISALVENERGVFKPMDVPLNQKGDIDEKAFRKLIAAKFSLPEKDISIRKVSQKDRGMRDAIMDKFSFLGIAPGGSRSGEFDIICKLGKEKVNCGNIVINGNDIIITVINPASIKTTEVQPQYWERTHFVKSESTKYSERDHWVQTDCRERHWREELDPVNRWKKTTVLRGSTFPENVTSVTLWEKDGQAVEAEESFSDETPVTVWKKEALRR